MLYQVNKSRIPYMNLNLFKNEIFILVFQVRFVAFRDRPIHERIAKFNHSIREGNVELVSIIDHTYEEQYFIK